MNIPNKIHNHFQIKNLGKDGETVNVIFNQITNHLKAEKGCDFCKLCLK
jgi:hypothetical protein